jgi:hypothetical protein
MHSTEDMWEPTDYDAEEAYSNAYGTQVSMGEHIGNNKEHHAGVVRSDEAYSKAYSVQYSWYYIGAYQQH